MALELYGVIAGYIVAALITLLFAYFLSKENKDGGKISSKEIVSFSVPMVFFAVSYVAIMNMDIFFVKALIENQSQVGYYTAARAIASIVFGGSLALSATLLPSVSKSHSKGDNKQTINYINNSIRYLLMILLPLAIIISLTSEKLLNFFYPTDYTQASTSLSILIFGIIFLMIFVVLGTIINGVGKPKLSMKIGLILIIIDIILNYFLVKVYGISGGAIATLITCLIGTFSLSILVIKMFRTLIPIKSFFRMISAGMTLIPLFFIIKNFIYDLFLFDFIIIYFILFGFYITILFASKELSKNEFLYFKKLFLKL